MKFFRRREKFLNMVISPLEQFELTIFLPIGLFFFDFSVTTLTIYLILVSFAILFVYFFSIYNPEFIPTRFQLLVEFLYSFILGLVLQQAGLGAKCFFPFFLFIFSFILFSNLLGLIPFGFTVTSHISVVFVLALSINLGLIFLGFYKNGLKFFYLFIPSGSPVWLLPLITIIEFFSYLIRTFSLSIRLFTNMTAGHTLLHMVVAFSLLFLSYSNFILFFFTLFLVLFILMLELGIAFLQAYVFVILSIIYMHDSFNPVH